MSQRWNSHRDIRDALGFPMTVDGIAPFLAYWDSLTREDCVKLRSMDLNNFNESDIPKPSEEQKHAAERIPG